MALSEEFIELLMKAELADYPRILSILGDSAKSMEAEIGRAGKNPPPAIDWIADTLAGAADEIELAL